MNDVEVVLLLLINLAVAVTCVYALVDCVRRPAAAFVAHGKQNKQVWSMILVVAVFVALVLGGVMGSFIGPFAAVAAIVYLVDVKPAITGRNNNTW